MAVAKSVDAKRKTSCATLVVPPYEGAVLATSPIRSHESCPNLSYVVGTSADDYGSQGTRVKAPLGNYRAIASSLLGGKERRVRISHQLVSTVGVKFRVRSSSQADRHPDHLLPILKWRLFDHTTDPFADFGDILFRGRPAERRVTHPNRISPGHPLPGERNG